MNIVDFWPNTPTPPISEDTVTNLLLRRKASYRGFASMEQEKGFLPTTANLSSPRGQEAARLLFFRGIEEMAESWEAEDYPHELEELIDAMNYFLSILILDPVSFPLEWSTKFFIRLLRMAYPQPDPSHPFYPRKITMEQLGMTSVRLGKIADTFRNRAWMNNAQALEWEGRKTFETEFGEVLLLILDKFYTWENFYNYYVAKDQVLQFRLRTNY